VGTPCQRAPRGRGDDLDRPTLASSPFILLPHCCPRARSGKAWSETSTAGPSCRLARGHWCGTATSSSGVAWRSCSPGRHHKWCDDEVHSGGSLCHLPNWQGRQMAHALRPPMRISRWPHHGPDGGEARMPMRTELTSVMEDNGGALCIVYLVKGSVIASSTSSSTHLRGKN
jgi:hypothetical protein